MSKSRTLYYIFVFFLLIFFWKTAEYWYSFTSSDEVASGSIMLYAALVMVESVSLYLIEFSPKYRCQQSRIPQLCLIWEMVMLVVLLFTRTPYSQWFKCMAWPLFFQASYLLIRSNVGLVKSLRKVFYVLTLMGTIYFVLSLLYQDLESQTNMVYFCLLTFPVLLLTPKKRQRYLLLIFSTFAAFISMKRSMILAFVLFWGLVEVKYMLGKGRKGLAVVVTAVMVIAMYGSFSVADDLTGGHLSERLSGEDARDGDITNGREGIYLVTIEMIKQSSLVHIILGNGHNGVRRDSPLEISAHNEFLEIIYDYGIIILMVYLGLWVYVLREWYFHYRNNTIFFLPYTMSVSIFAVMAMVSQLVLYCSYFLYLVIFWGIVAALKDSHASQLIVPKEGVITKKKSNQK